ncbi:DUF4826 family protein [Aliidiomarina quisquiliarum]|uniref:DUF4826 family protein n=1 Tax=Aliidiomarina quisquiliarum TaxID=2938947 RepID=UPI00208E0AF7|nr:DUF4826 family protein [Aliidiomarina quisquiliarum]MCO4320639.1 DUF4826 family protein [Aliidiomarina quisquiliarum]
MTAMTEQEMQEWVRAQFQRANAYLAERGLITNVILTKESRYFAPHLAVWKFTLQGLTEKVWAITGNDLPTDHIDASFAATPQDALRYFSYRWQLKADKILASELPSDAKQQEFAQILIRSAEKIYPLSENPSLWQE